MLIEPSRQPPGFYTLLLDAGHAEYNLHPAAVYDPDGKFGLGIEWFSQPEEGEDPEEQVLFDQVFNLLKDSPNNWLSGEDEGWTTLVRISGQWTGLLYAFKDLAARLMPSLDPSGYTPGGDDDYYDYYPSGMRLLHEMALDLTEILAQGSVTFGDHYADPGPLGVYFAVVADYLRREANRWKPNYITCASVGYDDFFSSEEVEHYVKQACEYFDINPAAGWGWIGWRRMLGRKFGLSEKAYARWASPTTEEREHMRKMNPQWEPTFTREQPPKKEETHA